MNKQEKDVLKGLFFELTAVGTQKLFLPEKILTFAKIKIPEERKIDYLEIIAWQSYRAKNLLNYLQESKLISFENYPIPDLNFRVSLTLEGVDFGRKLHSRIGQLDLLIRETKGGIWGILFSFIENLFRVLI